MPNTDRYVRYSQHSSERRDVASYAGMMTARYSLRSRSISAYLYLIQFDVEPALSGPAVCWLVPPMAHGTNTPAEYPQFDGWMQFPRGCWKMTIQ